MKKSFILLSILVFTIAGLLLSCDLFSLDEWFDFPTKAIITTEDTGEVKIGDTITLNGNTSVCGMNETLTYSWEITQKPAGSTVALETPTSKQSSLIPDYAGIYNIRLTVEDDDEDSDSCEYTLEVSAVITASAGTGGSINPSGDVSVTYGSDKTFTITPETGYEVSDVLVDGVSVGAVTSHTFDDVTENHTISATFSLVEYVITATAGTGGSISSSGDVSVTHGNDKTFTITPETGYEISDVLVDGTSVGAVSNYTFTDVIENHTISATFALVEYVITATAGTGGSISSSGDVSVTHGNDKTFTITPETGYEISDVLVDGTSVGTVSNYTFTDVIENHTISVTFSLVEYVITATAGTGGNISPSGDVSITHGSDKTFTITPNTGYEISDVLVDGTSVGVVTSHTFNDVIETHTISVTFVQSELTITFNKNATDAIGTMPTETVTNGEEITLPAVGFSRSGYTFSGWSLSASGAVVYEDQVTVTMGSSDVTLYAVWEITEYSIGSLGPAGGYIFYDKGTYSDEWRYLEAAPYGWYSGAVDPLKDWMNALLVCADIEIQGFSDWELPSKQYLDLMYHNLHVLGLGSFTSGSYYSSTRYDDENVWSLNFNIQYDGYWHDDNTSLQRYVRPIRKF